MGQELGAGVGHVHAAELLEGRREGDCPVQQAQFYVPAFPYQWSAPIMSAGDVVSTEWTTDFPAG